MGWRWLCCAAALAAPSVLGAPALRATFGEAGLAALAYGEAALLADGTCKVTGAFFRRWDGAVYAGPTTPTKVSAQPAAGQLTLAFDWGQVAIAGRAEGDRLRLTVDLETVRTADTLVALYLQFATLALPGDPRFANPSFYFYGKSNVAHNVGGPGVVRAEFAGGALVAVNEQMGPPLAFGFAEPLPAAAGGSGAKTWPLLAFTGRHPSLTKKYPFIERFVPPGGRDHWDLALRFGAADATTADLAADLYAAYAKAFPPTLQWPDRRPIGRLFIASAHGKLADNYPTNPRGWFNDRKVDVTTEEGRAAFRTRALAWADNAVKVCQGLDAQGMILWDPEGQEYPHMTSYLGDPRSLPPEMEPLADEFCQRFRDAKLRTGICIRPQRPVRLPYGDGVFQLGFAARGDRFKNLCDKIDVARKRWGCTLFYLDSNVDWQADPVTIPDAAGHSTLVDDDLLKDLAAKYSDCLLMPEWETLRTYAYCAPYSQLNYNKLTAPPADVLRVYPGAFLVNAPDEPSIKAAQEALIPSVKRGDILYFQGWYAAPENAIVKAIYAAATGEAPPPPGN